MNRRLVTGVAWAFAIMGSVIVFIFAAMPEPALFLKRQVIVGAAVIAYLAGQSIVDLCSEECVSNDICFYDKRRLTTH